MSCWKLVPSSLLLRASALSILLALAAAQSCVENSLYLGGRVTECVNNGDNQCLFGVCWGEQLNDYRNLTVNLTDEIRFACTEPGLTIWLLATREEYDGCEVTSEDSRMLKECNGMEDFSLYLVSNAAVSIPQPNFIQVQPDQTEVYVASLTSEGTAGACNNGAKATIGVDQPMTTVTTGTGGTDNGSGPPPESMDPVTPQIGELGSSGRGVLGCSVMIVLTTLLLSIVSLLY